MKTKMFEVRDTMTFIVVMATKLKAGNTSEKYLLSRVGYKDEDERIVVTKMSSLETNDHSDRWTDKTMQTIHSHLEEFFDELGFGAVLDAQYLRGETNRPCDSERGTPLEIVEGEPEWGLTLKEFADGMQEVEQSRLFLEQFRATKFEDVKSMIKFLHNLRPNPSWVAAILRMETKDEFTTEDIVAAL